VGDGEILKTYLNSASKNISETDIFPHGTKRLLTSVIAHLAVTCADRGPIRCIVHKTVHNLVV